MSYNSELGDETKVKISSRALARILTKKVVKFTALFILIVIVIYTCFAATIIRFVPSTSDTGIQLTKNITEEGGILSPGMEIMVDRENINDGSLGTHLRQAFLPSGDYMLTEVVAGPYGEIEVLNEAQLESLRASVSSEGNNNMDTDDLDDTVAGIVGSSSLNEDSLDREGNILIGGELLDITIGTNEAERISDRDYNLLNNEYIVKCISGDCIEGNGYLISKDHVAGERVDMSGLLRGDLW